MTALRDLRAITHDVTDLADRLALRSIAIDAMPTADQRGLSADDVAWLRDMRVRLAVLEREARVVGRQCAAIELAQGSREVPR